MKRYERFLLLLVVVVGVFLRTYKLHNALGDWHSWRQADTASVAREYVKHGIDLLHPKYQDLSSIPSGLDNPEGYRFVEFPLVNALHAKLYSLFPSVGFVEWGRILSIFASGMTIVLIFLLVRELSGFLPALLAAVAYAVFPYNVYYGRVILPEPWLVLGMMLSLYAFIRYWDTGKLVYWLTCFVSLAFAVLMKPTALSVFLPMAFYALSSWRTRRALRVLPLLLSLLPYLWWRSWVSHFPAGIPASSWLFNGNAIRFKGAWFRWLFGERISRLMLGYWGVVPVTLGAIFPGKRRAAAVYLGLMLGALAYLSIIATGNVQHDYYQIQIAPVLAILWGVGSSWLLKEARGAKRCVMGFALTAIFGLSLALSWYDVRGYFWVNNQAMVEAGQKVDEITPSDAVVIAPHQGDTAFLFQTNRRGFPIGGNIENDIKEGASYYVTTTKDSEFESLKNKYGVLVETPDYAIIHLSE